MGHFSIEAVSWSEIDQEDQQIKRKETQKMEMFLFTVNELNYALLVLVFMFRTEFQTISGLLYCDTYQDI